MGDIERIWEILGEERMIAAVGLIDMLARAPGLTAAEIGIGDTYRWG